ncbi:hypothetical protein MarSH_077 [Marseillevirus Shanghai 1]|nr:hypothetical protein MarSH_077 [Marseillevirus Shanghai 1]
MIVSGRRIYKVGRSSDWKQRQQSYGTVRILRVTEVLNSSIVEKNLIGKFKENFAVAKGSEYFFHTEHTKCPSFYIFLNKYIWIFCP